MFKDNSTSILIENHPRLDSSGNLMISATSGSSNQYHRNRRNIIGKQ
jgi:hypothetical protein